MLLPELTNYLSVSCKLLFWEREMDLKKPCTAKTQYLCILEAVCQKKEKISNIGENKLRPSTILSQYYIMSTQYKTLWKSYRYTAVHLWGERGISSPWTNVPWGLGLISTFLWLFVEQHSFIVDQSPSMPGLQHWILNFHSSPFLGITNFTK